MSTFSGKPPMYRPPGIIMLDIAGVRQYILHVITHRITIRFLLLVPNWKTVSKHGIN